MLEYFSLQDVPKEAVYICMPQNWNGNGIFKIFYTHSCCPEFICCMTCVPLYKTVAVHGTICDIDCSESVNFKVHINQYLRQKPNFMGKYVMRIFLLLNYQFKDSINVISMKKRSLKEILLFIDEIN